MLDRVRAEALLQEYVESESLRRHCRCVETAMRGYAEMRGQDPEEWGLAGLLHDFDYERFPDDHPRQGLRILEEMGAPTWLVRAIASHNSALGVPRETDLEKHLFACDELCGLIVAVAWVRPTKSVAEVEVKSVLKKFKTPAFAAGVNRDEVLEGAEDLGIGLEEHVGNVLRFLQADSARLGLG